MGTTQSVLDGFITLRVPMQLLKDLEALSHKERKTTSKLIREAIIERVSKTIAPR